MLRLQQRIEFILRLTPLRTFSTRFICYFLNTNPEIDQDTNVLLRLARAFISLGSKLVCYNLSTATVYS